MEDRYNTQMNAKMTSEDKVRIQELAKQIGVSSSYLLREGAKFMGEFLVNKKVKALE